MLTRSGDVLMYTGYSLPVSFSADAKFLGHGVRLISFVDTVGKHALAARSKFLSVWLMLKNHCSLCLIIGSNELNYRYAFLLVKATLCEKNVALRRSAKTL
jgi:hypothetical protein